MLTVFVTLGNRENPLIVITLKTAAIKFTKRVL